MKPIQQFAKAVLLTVLAFTAQLLAADKSWAQNERCIGFGDFQSISLTDWEGGLASWTAATYGVANPDTFDTPDWAAVDDLPDGRAGRAAFVANLEAGSCDEFGDDDSGALTLTSPSIDIPADANGPRIAFSHWFDIEDLWDGGNLKISVNGGPFTLVPGSAFEVGSYTDVLYEAVRDEVVWNTNPLAEQEAFTGPGLQGGGGSWEASRINLAGIAGAGDSIELRFDFGIDYCGGAVGWYVDDVEVYSCEEADGARLTLVNDVINDNGGAAVAEEWTLTAIGPTDISGTGPTVSSGDGFETGRYDLSVSDGPFGYSAGQWTCVRGTQIDSDTVDVAAGDDVTCTIRLEDTAPSLTLVNQVVNDDGGTAEPSDWTLHATGPVSFSGPGPSVSSGDNFIAGSYDLSLSGGPNGYLAGAWMCDGGTQTDRDTISLDVGVSITCTVTNDDIAGGFQINSAISDSWFYPPTNGQGFFIIVWEDIQQIFLSWFTYEVERPPEDATAVVGEPGHRWLVAQGPFEGDTATLDVYLAKGMIFDSEEPPVEDSVWVGTMVITWTSCTSGVLVYDLPESGLQGEIPIQRITLDNVPACEAAQVQGSNALLANNHKATEDSLEADQAATRLTLVRQLTDDSVGSTPDSAWELNAHGPTPLSGSRPIVSSVEGFAAGTYDLSVSNGPLGYSAGEWFCAGGSQLSADTINLAKGDSATCIFTTDDNGNGLLINSGITDSWFYPPTNGQGFFIIVWEDIQQIFLSWFTYEVERPPEDATAVVGEPGHRWLVAQGPFEGDTATLDVYLAKGMIFDSEEPPVEDSVWVGTMVITWTNCTSGLLVYDLPESGLQGEIPIQRITLDNVPACEAAQSPQQYK